MVGNRWLCVWCHQVQFWASWRTNSTSEQSRQGGYNSLRSSKPLIKCKKRNNAKVSNRKDRQGISHGVMAKGASVIIPKHSAHNRYSGSGIGDNLLLSSLTLPVWYSIFVIKIENYYYYFILSTVKWQIKFIPRGNGMISLKLNLDFYTLKRFVNLVVVKLLIFKSITRINYPWSKVYMTPLSEFPPMIDKLLVSRVVM